MDYQDQYELKQHINCLNQVLAERDEQLAKRKKKAGVAREQLMNAVRKEISRGQSVARRFMNEQPRL